MALPRTAIRTGAGSTSNPPILSLPVRAAPAMGDRTSRILALWAGGSQSGSRLPARREAGQDSVPMTLQRTVCRSVIARFGAARRSNALRFHRDSVVDDASDLRPPAGGAGAASHDEGLGGRGHPGGPAAFAPPAHAGELGRFRSRGATLVARWVLLGISTPIVFHRESIRTLRTSDCHPPSEGLTWGIRRWRGGWWG